MKRILSLLLVVMLLVSAVPAAYATNDYTQGTQVVFEATGTEAYTITVPALLAPGGSGTVTLAGTWADNRIVTVTADPTVTLTNSIQATDTKTLDVNFDGISEAGSNTAAQTFTEDVAVANIEAALFGTWNGKFNYNVETKTADGTTTVAMYSYNDVILPDINTVWTDEMKQTYPYGVLTITDTDAYEFILSAEPTYCVGFDLYIPNPSIAFVLTDDGKYVQEWKKDGEGITTTNIVVWTNTDIPWEGYGEEIFLEASDPVPVS